MTTITITGEGLREWLKDLLFKEVVKMKSSLECMQMGEEIGKRIEKVKEEANSVGKIFFDEYKKVKCQRECLKAGMEAMEEPLIITFTRLGFYQVSHSVKHIIFPCNTNGLSTTNSSLSFYRAKPNYLYLKSDFTNGNLYSIENKLFICRHGERDIYLIQIPKGLN